MKLSFVCDICGVPDKGKDIYMNSMLFAIMYESYDKREVWVERNFCYDCQAAINQAIFDRKKLPKTP